MEGLAFDHMAKVRRVMACEVIDDVNMKYGGDREKRETGAPYF